jgi:hypothetical protein
MPQRWFFYNLSCIGSEMVLRLMVRVFMIFGSLPTAVERREGDS